MLARSRRARARAAGAQAVDGWMHGLPPGIRTRRTPWAFRPPSGSRAPLWKDLRPTGRRRDGCAHRKPPAASSSADQPAGIRPRSHTYNQVLAPPPTPGTRRSPWAAAAAGAVAALALRRLLPVPDGSFHGQPSQPAGWTNTIGLRPSQDRVPLAPKPELFVSQLATRRADGPHGARRGAPARHPGRPRPARAAVADDRRALRAAAGRVGARLAHRLAGRPAAACPWTTACWPCASRR